MNRRIMGVYAATLSAMLDDAPFLGSPRFSGDANCKNCRKPTMSSEFCDLRCACEYKRRVNETQDTNRANPPA